MAVPAPFDYISVAAGGGGLDMGLRLAVPSARCVCYVEREAAAAALLVAHMQDGSLDDAPLWSDLRTFDGRRWRGLVDAVIGGIPCQPWSVAGKRRGADDERNLWPDALRVIRESELGIVWIENVGGILRDGYHGIIKPDLEGVGYRVEADIFTASEVGAPHRRERLFILAHSESLSFGTRLCSAYPDGIGSRRFDDVRDGLADAERNGGRECKPGERPEWRAVASRTGPAMGDASKSGLQRSRFAKPERWGIPVTPDGDWPDVPQWPPKPGDRAGWSRVLAARPDLAPATAQPTIRRVANELARTLDRTDRLAILGNGVVPEQAAYAFRVLYGRLTTA